MLSLVPAFAPGSYIHSAFVTLSVVKVEVPLGFLRLKPSSISSELWTTLTPEITAHDNANRIVGDPHECVVLIFAAKQIGGTSWNWATNGRSLFGIHWEDHEDIGAIVMTGLIFTVESDLYQIQAQSLLFQALVILVD